MMGLNCTHGAFDGAYSAFNRLRQAVCRAAGGRYPFFSEEDVKFLKEELGEENPTDASWYMPEGFTAESSPGLYAFLCHSDCDGELSPEECVRVADALEKILPNLEDGPTHGHLERVGSYRANVQKFIDGCRLAASAGETLKFR